jgi:hypothetical protein
VSEAPRESLGGCLRTTIGRQALEARPLRAAPAAGRPLGTWIPEDRLPPSLSDDVLRMAYVRISTGAVAHSVPNTTVRPEGFVPGA